MPPQVFARRLDKIYLCNYYGDGGFAVGWELRGPEPHRTLRNTLNFAHLSCPQHAGVEVGGRDESDTVPAHGEPTVCRSGLHTHKLPSSEVAGDHRAETGTRHKWSLGVGG